jgi:hypothetical protein
MIVLFPLYALKFVNPRKIDKMLKFCFSRVLPTCNFIMGIKLYSLFLSKSFASNSNLHPLLDIEVPEMDLCKIPEDCHETEEIIKLIPMGEGLSEDTNIVGTKASAGAFTPIIFQKFLYHVSIYWLFMFVH